MTTTTWNTLDKPGTTTGGWTYNEPGLTYNQTVDSQNDLVVYYNGLGTEQTWTNEAK